MSDFSSGEKIEIFGRARDIYQEYLDDLKASQIKHAKHANAVGPFTGKLFNMMPELLRAQELIDNGEAALIEPIRISNGTHIEHAAEALSIAATAIGHTLTADFNQTPLVVSPEISPQEAIDTWHAQAFQTDPA